MAGNHEGPNGSIRDRSETTPRAKPFEVPDAMAGYRNQPPTLQNSVSVSQFLVDTKTRLLPGMGITVYFDLCW